MSLKKGTPGRGAEGRADSFSYTPVAVGLAKTWTAWLAGDPYWCLAHEHTERTPGTKPCLTWLTDSAVRCPRCRPAVVPTWIGYVPLYREQDHKPVIVIVHESCMDLLEGLSYPQHVIVGRVDAVSGVFVRKSDSPVSFRTTNEQRQRPRDITPQLLTMWRLPELDQWVGHATPAARQAARDTDRDALAALQGTGGGSGDGAELVGDVLGNVGSKDARNRIRQGRGEPSANGHTGGQS